MSKAPTLHRPAKHDMERRSDGNKPVGQYRHYKGGLYEVIGFAKHTETEEELVIYRQLYGNTRTLWVRPAKMFFEEVQSDGEKVPRFTYIKRQ